PQQVQEVGDGTHCAYEGMVWIGLDGTQIFWGAGGPLIWSGLLKSRGPGMTAWTNLSGDTVLAPSKGRLIRRTSRRRVSRTVTFSAVGASSAACRLSMKIPLSAIELLQIMVELPQLVERKKLLHSASCIRIATTDRRRFHCSTRQLCYDLTRNR